MQTLGDLLEEAVEQYGPRPALLTKPRYRTEVWTYGRLWDESSRLACWLIEQGIRKGDRIVLWAPNSPCWVAAYFASARLGSILVPLDVRSSPDFVRRVITQSEPKLALLSRLTVGSWDYPVPAFSLEDLAPPKGSLPDLPGPSLEPDDIAELMFTSGTTGDPKGVIVTHGNITSNAEAVNQVIPRLPFLRLLSILPLSHMFEQTAGLVLPLTRGASIFYPASRQSTILFRAFQEQRITTVLAVPQALQLFMNAIEREVRAQGKEERWRLLQTIAEHLPVAARRLLFHPVHQRLGGELQFVVSGGAPLDPALAHRWELLGIPVLQGYGATETGPVVTATSLDDHNPRTVGKAVPGVQLRLASNGEVLVRGPNVTPGYWRNPEATEAAFEDGWYRMGDAGELDAQGHLHLRGRTKNLIVLANGQNVYPEDVEWALHQTEGVSDAIVLGLPAAGGCQVHAVLLCDEGRTSADPATLVRLANELLAPHQHIQGFTLWPEPDFPRTHTLKVKRHEVLARVQELQSGSKQAPRPAPHKSGDERPIRRLVAEAAGLAVEELEPGSTLGDDAGLDSLGRVELLAAIEAELGVYLDEALVGPSTTLAELERLVQSQEGGARPEFPAWPLSPVAAAVRSRLQGAAFALLGRVAPCTIVGGEILESLSPPVLFVANHTSHLDTPTLLHALPGRLRRRVAVAAAADYFFSRRWLGVGVALLLNAFPFSRTTAVRPTLEHCAGLLDRGWSILLYPEGTRSTSGAMGAFQSGVGLLAVELDVTVVPVRLDGLAHVLPKGRALPRRGAVTVTVGHPLRFEPGTSYAAAASALEEAVRRAGHGGPPHDLAHAAAPREQPAGLEPKGK